MKKRLLSVLLILCMALTLLPVGVLAEGEAAGDVTNTEASVQIGSGAVQKTATDNGIHSFTAKSTDKLTIVQSGNDGIDGNSNNKYGYYPKIVMPAVSDGAKGSTYYILSRGTKNQNGLVEATLGKVMNEATKEGGALSSKPATVYHDGENIVTDAANQTLATWFQVYTATQWGTANSAYWPQIGSDPIVNIVVAISKTEGEGESATTSYAYEKYKFDFSEATAELPFTITGVKDSDLNGTSMTAAALQSGVTMSNDATSVKDKTATVTGASNYVDFPWFGTDTTEGNYVAMKIKPNDGVQIKEMSVTLSNGSPKKLDSDNVLIWQFKTDNDGKITNGKIPLKVTFGTAQQPGATIAYTIDVSGMQLQKKQEGSVTFQAVPDAKKTIFEKDVTTLGSYTYSPSADGKSVAITGSSKWTEGWTQFNTADATEQNGHYLPIQIVLPYQSSYEGVKVTVSGSKTKEITGFTSNDHAVELVMLLNNLPESKFTVKVEGFAEDGSNASANGTYTVDCSKITKEKLDAESLQVYTVVDTTETLSTLLTAKLEGSTITVSGSLANVGDDGVKVKIGYKTNLNDTEKKSDVITLTESEDKLAPSSAQKLTVAGTEYTLAFDVTAVNTPVSAPVTDAKVDANKITGVTDTTGVETAVKSTAVADTSKNLLTDKATDIAADLETKKEIPEVTEATKAQLTTAGVSVSDGTDISIAVVPVVKVELTSYTETDTNKTLSVQISAEYKLVATTADLSKDEEIKLAGDGINAVAVGTGGRMEVTEPIDLEINLPSGFAADGKLYVLHHGQHYHEGIVSSNKLTFTSDDGLSPFVIDSTKTGMAASIGTEYYETLAAAVAVVKDGETIVLQSDCSEGVKVSRAVAFTLNTNGKTFSGSITADGNFELDKSANVASGSYKFVAKQIGGVSWGGISTGNAITAPASTPNGKVSISSATAKQGDTVTVTVTPDSGYVLDTLTVTDAAGKAVTVTRTADGKYTFTMPATAVKVDAAFKKAAALPFTDVANGAWYYDAVAYVHGKGLMNGTADTLFSPDMTTTRGMVVTLLYRLEGQPAAPAPGFTDVPDGQWYSKAIAWATVNKIVNGYGDGTFGPDDTMTREQLAAVLYRYAGYKGYDVSAKAGLAEFKDAASVSAYARDALAWAVAKGLVNGVSADSLAPQGIASRAQLATILMRFCETVAK